MQRKFPSHIDLCFYGSHVQANMQDCHKALGKTHLFCLRGCGIGKKGTPIEDRTGLKNQGRDVTSTVWWGSLWVGIHTHTQGCSQGARSEGVSHTLVLGHTHLHRCGLAQRSTWGDTVDKVGLWEMFWLPVEPLSSGLRAPAPPGPQGRVEGRKGEWPSELGTGKEEKRG